MSVGFLLLLFSAFLMVGYNVVSLTFWPWGVIGMLQVVTILIWYSNLIIQLIYNLVNADYLIKKYDITTYSTITFYDPLGISFSDETVVEQIIWWEQLVFGNRRS